MTLNSVRAYILPKFPALIDGDGGFEVVKVDGKYTFRPALGTLTETTEVEGSNYVWSWNKDSNTYSRVATATLRGSPGPQGTPGTNGTNGTNGADGATGQPGPAGGAISIPYVFSTTTTDADPGNGNLRLGSATQNTATVIRTDLLASDGTDWSAVLGTLAASTSTIKGQIRLFKTLDPTKWLLFNVTAVASPTGYKNITVAIVGSSAASPFANGDAISLSFTRSGDQGAAGAGTGDVLAANNGSEFVDKAVTRTNLGVAIGSNVQAWDADLDAVAALTATGLVRRTATNTWSAGTAVTAAEGGTGQTSYTIGDILQASSTTALAKLAAVATGNVLISGGVGTASSWGKVGLTTHVSGTLPLANGGTNATTASGARTSLGLVIGMDVQAYNASLQSLSGITVSAAALTLLDDADTAAMLVTLGAEAMGQRTGFNTQTGTTYTLVLSDKGKVVEMNNASANTLTVPPNSSVAFPVGSWIDLRQLGAGQTTIAAGSGVTIRSYGTKLKLTGQYAGATLVKRSTDEWTLDGNLSA
ncbi:hypothetical protein [Kaistia sp. MMO-174]|uniref:hypothetical protein n=1 Tax=Kaistia sp. MMO-174 TaxID=3081256 RepID=UPI00301A669D